MSDKMTEGFVSLALAAGAFAADRITKGMADRRLKNGRTKSCLNGAVRFQRAENTGFAKSRLAGHKKLVTIVSTVVFAICLLIYAAVLTGSHLKALKYGMGLMAGGAAGNVFDRVIKGRVTDFIIVRPIDSIIFNLADVFILTGCVVTALCDLLQTCMS